MGPGETLAVLDDPVGSTLPEELTPELPTDALVPVPELELSVARLECEPLDAPNWPVEFARPTTPDVLDPLDSD